MNIYIAPTQQRELQDIISLADPAWVTDLLNPLQGTDGIIQNELPPLAQRYWTMLVILNQQLLQQHRSLTLAFSDLEKKDLSRDFAQNLAVSIVLQSLLDKTNDITAVFQLIYALFFQIIEKKTGAPQTGKAFDVRQGFCLVETDAAMPRSLNGVDMIRELALKQDSVELIFI